MKKFLIAILCLPFVSLFSQGQDISDYTLPNGMRVLLWEVPQASSVYGFVAVKAGAIDEPAEHTGLAHYLEHMLFKGTDKIGAIDWEKEKPYYEEVIRLYEELGKTTDEGKRTEIQTKINEASIEASKYSLTKDFNKLLDMIGASGVNAGTSYDFTYYVGNFPQHRMLQWLTIYCDRMKNPVFRTFQAELENVFEEYNMYEDQMNSRIYQQLSEALYEGHPYARPVIGYPEHLKNPSLSSLIEFYNTWYVPNNMALVLVGDFSAKDAKPMIEQTFGKLPSQTLPAREQHTMKSIAGKNKKTYKMGYSPRIYFAYNGVKANDKDKILLDFVTSLLSNGMNTGLLDKITMDGEVGYATAYSEAHRDGGKIIIAAVPYYDINQKVYESNATTQKTIQKELDKLKEGNVSDWLIASVKEDLLQQLDMLFESQSAKANLLLSSFIYDIPLQELLGQKEFIQSITRDEIMAVAKKYFSTDFMMIEFEEGKLKKNKLAKPKIKPVEQPHNAVTQYEKDFLALSHGQEKLYTVHFDDVKVIDMADKVKLHHGKNPQNNLFSLTLRYGVGTEEMPMLEYAVSLMNTAGIQPDTKNQKFRRYLSQLGGRCTYSVDEDYFYVQIVGNEEKLAEICALVQRQMLFPKLEDKQLDNIKGRYISFRLAASKDDSYQEDALYEYILYGKKSSFLDVPSIKSVYESTLSELLAEFVKARNYELDIYYCGQRSENEVQTILNQTLPMVENLTASKSPQIRKRQQYDKTNIFFLPNSNIQQAKIYFYFEGTPYTLDEIILRSAFNSYFSGGFTGLVVDEIRERRSMAYTAYGQIVQPRLPNNNDYFIGYIGTQSDKVADAVDVFMNLANEMPLYPERITNIKELLRQRYNSSNQYNFRDKPMRFDYLQEFGYTEEMLNKQALEKIDKLTFDDIQRYYEQKVKGKPMTIIIMGDPKLIDTKALSAKYGKVSKVEKAKIFAPISWD